MIVAELQFSNYTRRTKHAAGCNRAKPPTPAARGYKVYFPGVSIDIGSLPLLQSPSLPSPSLPFPSLFFPSLPFPSPSLPLTQLHGSCVQHLNKTCTFTWCSG